MSLNSFAHSLRRRLLTSHVRRRRVAALALAAAALASTSGLQASDERHDKTPSTIVFTIDVAEDFSQFVPTKVKPEDTQPERGAFFVTEGRTSSRPARSPRAARRKRRTTSIRTATGAIGTLVLPRDAPRLGRAVPGDGPRRVTPLSSTCCPNERKSISTEGVEGAGATVRTGHRRHRSVRAATPASSARSCSGSTPAAASTSASRSCSGRSSSRHPAHRYARVPSHGARGLEEPSTMPRSILAFAFGLGLATAAQAGVPDRPAPPPATDNAVLRWNAALLEAVRAVRLAPPMTARALAIAHTCDVRRLGRLRSTVPTAPASAARCASRSAERTLANKTSAVSYAAHRALLRSVPDAGRRASIATLRDLGLDPLDGSTGAGDRRPASATPPATRCIAVRHADGANQLGDLNGGPPYSDYTGYAPVNDPEHLPRSGALAAAARRRRHGAGVPRAALAPRGPVRAGDGGRVPAAAAGDAGHAPSTCARPRRSRAFSAQLDRPPEGHRGILGGRPGDRDAARATGRCSRRGCRAAIATASTTTWCCSSRSATRMLDASIAVWDAKVFYDYVRPVSAVRSRLRRPGDRGVGAVRSRARDSSPASSSVHTSPRRPSPSTPRATARSARPRRRCCACSPAARASARRWSSRPAPRRSSLASTPAKPVALSWRTFDDAADEAGLSRRLGGIHFRDGDSASRAMGKAIGRRVFREVLRHVLGFTEVSR